MPAILAAGLAAGPLAAQIIDPVARSNDLIIVGDRPDRDQARAFVEDHLVAARSGQFARWFEPVCARTWGLDLDYNAYISNRVMDLAERVGIPTDRSEYCRPNVRIGFTGDPQDMIERVAHRNHLVLGFHYAQQHDRLTTVRFPIQAWYATTTRNAAGNEYLDDLRSETVSGAPGSRLSARISAGLAHVLILVDTRTAVGQPTESVADLIAFMALAQSTQTDSCAPGRTILDLMLAACPAGEPEPRLTWQDVAFLHALYRIDPELNPQQQRGAILLDMTRFADRR